MKAERKLIALLAVAALVSIVNASVFVYYPITVNLQPTQPPIIFSKGKNAGEQDLYGSTIGVSMGSANTSLTITVHPTYQTNYYKNITVINNIDSSDSSNSYYVAIRVNKALSNSDSKITEAKLLIFDSSGTNIAVVDLLTTGTTSWLGPLNANGKWFVDINITISETGGSPGSAPFTSDSASLQLIYSPQNVESAP
jgi:hypothetical protein